MELHQLRDFVAIAKTGSFSRAALSCRIAQPSLSKAIQRLEAEIGEKLFVRLNRRAVLTQTGEMVFKRAVKIIDEMAELKHDLANRQRLKSGSVRVGLLPSITPYFLPSIISRFSKEFPAVEVAINEEVNVNLLELIDACKIELAIMTLPIPTRFDVETLFTEDLLLAVDSTHPLARKDKVWLRDLEKERFILMRDNCLGAEVMSFCAKLNLILQVAFSVSQIETIQSLILSRLGVALVPRMAQNGEPHSLVYRELEKPKPTRTIVAVWRRGRQHSRATTEFIKYLRQAAKEHQAS